MHRIGNYTAFFGADDVFSNWHRCHFTYRGFTFTSVEQFMMLAKAKLFADEKSARAIMATSDPAQQKRSVARSPVSTRLRGRKA